MKTTGRRSFVCVEADEYDIDHAISSAIESLDEQLTELEIGNFNAFENKRTIIKQMICHLTEKL